ncbi:MAG: TIGR00725 family protein [candidate division Zixibacteria bacterium]|nr:TIGR00725 family protein [candidate division Zixibacteria bacterium]
MKAKQPKKIDKKIFIGVIGAGTCSKKIYDTAQEVGKFIAGAGAVLVCGGLGGVMEGAAKGVRENGGVTIGIIPGESREEANPYIDFPIVTGFGEGRNLVVIRSSDVIIALPGKYGTLSELSFCMKLGKPVVSLGSWDISDKIVKAKDPKNAIKLALEMVK